MPDYSQLILDPFDPKTVKELEQYEVPKLIKDLGMQFFTENSKKRERFGLWECHRCKNEFRSSFHSIKSGNAKTCGCLHRDLLIKRNLKHGLSHTKIYKKWKSLKGRMLRDSGWDNKYYKGKGITLFDGWRDDFMVFYKWAIKNGYVDGLEIDRINTLGNYMPDNCRFVPRIINAENTTLLNSNNTSGFRGVHFCNTSKKWIAQCCFGIGRKHLGRFNTKEDAARAYNNFIIENKLAQPLNPLPDVEVH